MGLWLRENMDIEKINQYASNTLIESLGIQVTEQTPNSLKGKMPVDHRTIQPYGLLHGGASCALAETLGSIASNLVVDTDKYTVVGQTITANHIRSARSGEVFGEALAVHVGRRSHIWEIRIKNGQGQLICTSYLTMAIVEK